MAAGARTKSKTTPTPTPVADERPITEIVREAVQFTHSRLDTLRAARDEPNPFLVTQERRWPLAVGLSAATIVSASFWCGLWMLISR